MNLPWGEGGSRFGEAQQNAIIRIFKPDADDFLRTRLAKELADSLPAGQLRVVMNDLGTGTFDIKPTSVLFEGNVLAVSFDFSGTIKVGAPDIITPSTPDASEPVCTITEEVAPSAITLRFSLGADHLGRVVANPTSAPWSLTLWKAPERHVLCEDRELVSTPSRHSDLILDSLLTQLFPLSVNALPKALGLNLAFSWSQTIAPDALGAGIARASLHASTPLLGNAPNSKHLLASFELGTSFDPHPCVAHLGTTAVTAPSPLDTLEYAGTALSFPALSHLSQQLWLSGGLCGRSPLAHGNRIELPFPTLIHAWPELERWSQHFPEATLSLELWPESLPNVRTVEPPLLPLSDYSFAVETGRLQMDLVVTFGGARWRLATLVTELTLEGEFILTPEGQLTFHLLEAIPTHLEGSPGLTTPPSEAQIDAILTPFITLLLEGILLGSLPLSLAPEVPTLGYVQGDYVIFAPDAPHTRLVPE